MSYYRTFCKMFENVPFFELMHLKFAKSAIKTSKNIVSQKICGGSEKRKILCSFQIRPWKIVSTKSYRLKNLCKYIELKDISFSIFFACNFFKTFFWTPFNELETA